MHRVILRFVALLLLAGLPARAQATFTLNATPEIISTSGGSVTFTVNLGYQVTVSAISVKVLAPSSQWTYSGNAGTNVPQILPRVGDTGNVGDGYGFLYFTIPPGSASYSFTLKYPAKLTTPQVFQASATLSSTAGEPAVLMATATVGLAAVSPAITTQPADVSVLTGGTASFTAAVSGTTPLVYQWRRNGIAISAATGSTYTLSSVQLADAGSYELSVSNAAGSVVSRVVKLSVTLSPTRPVVEKQPEDVLAATASTVTFSVVASGTPAPTYHWQRQAAGSTTWVNLSNTTTYAGVTAATLSIRGTTAAMNGDRFRCNITNSAGSIATEDATLAISLPPSTTARPTVEKQPEDVLAATASTVTFSVVASGTPAPAYLWQRQVAGSTTWVNLSNTTTYAGVTTATLSIRGTTAAMNGDRFRCNITNSAGSIATEDATLAISSSPSVPTVKTSARLSNLSVRAATGSGDQSLIVGFVIGGSGSKQVLVRAIGPTLAQFGVGGALGDPTLSIFNASSARIGANDNWAGSSTLSRSFTQVGAFTLPSSSKDAAITMALPTGACTAQINGVGGSTGVSLAEVYDADADNPSAGFINLSARNHVGGGDAVLVVGFVIEGNSNETLLIRGIGPSLTEFGVGGALPDPQIKLFNQQGQTIDENDNWGGTSRLVSAFAQTGAFSIAAGSKDAALLVSLPPGVYTAQVSGVANTTGVALIEVYEVR